MRVIAGSAKGRRLRVPAGLHVRPSGARLRESAFGILEHRGAIDDAHVLDLFAGTGALGIEALSRGAASLVAVERDRSVAKLLTSNVEHAGFAERTRVVVQPADRAVAQMPASATFDLVLIDPPYREGLAQPVLDRLAERGLVKPGGLVLIEHARLESLTWPETWELELERRFGDSTITLLRATQPDHRSEVPTHAHH
ncbi:16S rRNA (guanine(966)-N(2))-methyltransferase RsmD [Candidatus Binatia bacterium]|jgi:16S rRNA (guanine966-N2)-methyltransferase|nr:16S rRNA (guanine(966)-N(2))-methyltransferase RsmD [Candidatus Binatia bacterium]